MKKLIIEDCLQLVEFFKTLGDFTRLRIVLELKTKRCVGELAEELEMSHSAVSHQLNILKANGIVKSQRQGFLCGVWEMRVVMPVKQYPIGKRETCLGK